MLAIRTQLPFANTGRSPNGPGLESSGLPCGSAEVPASREGLERLLQERTDELERLSAQLVRETEERRRLEEALCHMQRIEALGRLVAGVAHDLNNSLTVVLGYSDILLSRQPRGDPQAELLQQIRASGERATALTRQLLAFSRKPENAVCALDLNAVIDEIAKMLRRLLGEDVELVTVLDPWLWQVNANPSQIEQVLLNLAANARDAMPQGGRLTIQTSNLEVAGRAAAAPREISAGRHVVVTVSDTGCGMDAATTGLTTKEQGNGTGLGMTAVYDIVRRSHGQIAVASEPGQGTACRIYLKAVEELTEPVAACRSSAEPAGGSETILLAEDDDQLRPLLRRVLGQSGYTVLEARNGSEALRLSEEHQGTIDLMVTDVVMPQMSGPELARRLGLCRPAMKVLYMSGYPGESALRHGVPDLQTGFLQKPFTGQALEHKVREVLGQKGV